MEHPALGQWYHQYPNAVMRAGNIGMMTGGVGLLILTVAKMLLANSSKVNEYLHGSARWANIQDIRQAGLLPQKPTFWQKIRGKKTSTFLRLCRSLAGQIRQLALYRDQVVARNVSRSEFRIKDLMNHDDPVSLYIVTLPNDKTRLRPLVRIMVTMIVRLLADKILLRIAGFTGVHAAKVLGLGAKSDRTVLR